MSIPRTSPGQPPEIDSQPSRLQTLGPAALGNLEAIAASLPQVGRPPTVLDQEPTNLALNTITPRPRPLVPPNAGEIVARILRDYEGQPEQPFNVARFLHVPGAPEAARIEDPTAEVVVEPEIRDELWFEYSQRLMKLAAKTNHTSPLCVAIWITNTMESHTAQMPGGQQFVRQQAARLIVFMEQLCNRGLFGIVKSALELFDTDTISSDPDQSIGDLAQLRVRLQIETTLKNPFLDPAGKHKLVLAFIIAQFKIDLMLSLFIGDTQPASSSGSSSSSTESIDRHAVLFYNLRRYADVLDLNLPAAIIPPIELEETSAGDYEQTLRQIIEKLAEPNALIQYMTNSYLLETLDETPAAEEVWEHAQSEGVRCEFKQKLEAGGEREVFLAECQEEIKANFKRSQLDNFVRLFAMERRPGQHKVRRTTTEEERQLAKAAIVLEYRGVKNPPLAVIRNELGSHDFEAHWQDLVRKLPEPEDEEIQALFKEHWEDEINRRFEDTLPTRAGFALTVQLLTAAGYFRQPPPAAVIG